MIILLGIQLKEHIFDVNYVYGGILPSSSESLLQVCIDTELRSPEMDVSGTLDTKESGIPVNTIEMRPKVGPTPNLKEKGMEILRHSLWYA